MARGFRSPDDMLSWQYRSILEELNELQRHASDPSCPCLQSDKGEYCLHKHSLGLHTLAKETASMDPGNVRLFEELAEEALDQHNALKDRITCGRVHKDERDTIEWARAWRKRIEPIYYACGVRARLHSGAAPAAEPKVGVSSKCTGIAGDLKTCNLTWAPQKVYHKAAESAGQARMFSEDSIMPRLAAALCAAGSGSACMEKATRPVCSPEQATRLERCILDVKERVGKANPFAVCTASVGYRRASTKVERGRANMRKVAELSVEELEALIKRIVRREMEEMLGDPDEGLVLRDEVVARLQRSLAAKRRGLSTQQVAAKLGLKWPADIK